MASDSLRWLTMALGLTLWIGFYGAPTKLLSPPAGFAVVSLHHQITAETEQGDADGGTTESGSSDDESGSSEEEESD